MGGSRIEGIPGRGNSLSKGREVRLCNGYSLEDQNQGGKCCGGWGVVVEDREG